MQLYWITKLQPTIPKWLLLYTKRKSQDSAGKEGTEIINMLAHAKHHRHPRHVEHCFPFWFQSWFYYSWSEKAPTMNTKRERRDSLDKTKGKNEAGEHGELKSFLELLTRFYTTQNPKNAPTREEIRTKIGDDIEEVNPCREKTKFIKVYHLNLREAREWLRCWVVCSLEAD